MADRIRFPDHIQLTTSQALDILAPLETIAAQLILDGEAHAAFQLDQAAEILRRALFLTD